jgi:diguanylate cyclase (GGDEF)-like protein
LPEVRRHHEGSTPRAWWVYIVGVSLVLMVYFADPHVAGLPGWFPRYPLYICVNASAVGALVLGIRIWRPRPATPWWLMAVGQASYTIGDFLEYWARDISHGITFPGLPDVFYLSRLPFMVAALALLVRRRSGRDRAALIDSLIVCVGVGLLSWVFLMEPYTDGGLNLAVRLTSLAYPVTDLMLVALAVRLLAGSGRRGVSFFLLTGGLILLAATDSVFGWLNLHNVTYASGGFLEAGWLLYYLTVGACALHPSMRWLASPLPRGEVVHSRARLVALSAAALAGPILLACETALGRHVDAFPIALGSIASFILVMLRLTDVMHHQQRAELQLRHQAFHDPLTGLANRSLLYDRLEHALESNRRQCLGLAVLMIDLDRFKLINDSLGHAVGDELLVAAANRISECLRSTDTAGRIGGDEFVVLAVGVSTVDEAGALARRIIDGLAEPMTLAGHRISISASVGVAVATTGGEDVDLLVNDADTAMYEAKRRLPGTYRVFEAPMHVSLPEVGLDVELRSALTNGELVVYYQPITSVDTGTIVGAEALVRWEHPQRGLIPPADFIPAAEATGIIIDVGNFVLRQACQQLRAWRDRWPEQRLGISVNLSARELAQPDLETRIGQCLHGTDLEPGLLTFELTESAVLVDPDQASKRLHLLKGLGVKLALDDFGTAFSSLSHLRRLPVDCLKIDKSFVDTVATDDEGFNFIKAVVRLAHTLGLTTVAEGVEAVEQVRGLRHAGCDFMQGYLVGRPMTASDVAAQIDGAKSNTAESVLSCVEGALMVGEAC